MNEPLTPKQAEYIAAMIEAMATSHWKRGVSGNLALENWQMLGQALRESHGLMAVGSTLWPPADFQDIAGFYDPTHGEKP